MARDYIYLESSDSSIKGKFPVIQEGHKISYKKSSEIKETVGGGLDGSFGGVYETHIYLIRVRHTEDVDGYGDLKTLIDLFKLNDPNGTPTNVIKLQDHYYGEGSSQMNVWMVGTFEQSVLGCEVIGLEAWYTAQVELRVIP